MSLSEQLEDFDPFAGPVIATTAPSSEAQREIWTATLTEVDASLAYNESITLILQGDVDLPALRAAFDDVVERHEALRTTLSADGLTLCICADRPALPHPVDLTDLEDAHKNAALQRVLSDEVSTPFDLERGPLYRVQFLRMGAREVRVVFTAHHIVVDGWSSAVIIKDWASFYNARRSETAARLPVAPTFTSYACHLLEAEPSPERAADERYWLGRFTSDLPVLDLPSDRPRRPLKSFRASRYDTTLDVELLTAIKQAGAQQRSSLFITLLAGFKALLFRLCAQEDLVIGVPAAGQSMAGYERLVGHCVNMLPLRSRLSADMKFAELLAAVRGTVIDGFEHQQYTFGTLLSKLPIPRDVSRTPLVSVVFNVDRGLTSEGMGFAGLSASCLTNPRRSENFELFLNIVELPTGLTLECQYNTDLFDAGTIARWLSAYERILRAVVADPTLPIGQLPVISAHELELFARWNAAVCAQRRSGQLVHELFEASAARTPDAIACEFEGDSITYRELNARANQLARRLRGCGVGRDALVGLCVERSINMLVGLWGVLKSGAAYLPLDPSYPLQRLAYMADDSGMAVLVTERRTQAELQLTASQTIYLDSDAALLASEASDDLPPDDCVASAERPAYVLYTSGSTGKPKGVVVAHRSLVNLQQSVTKVPGMHAHDVVLAVTTLAFDIAASELILPLSVGAKIILVSRELASDGVLLLNVMQRARVTFIDATPATYRLLLGAGFEGDPKLTAICTGEAMPRDLALDLVDKVGALWNGYGPTETTVWSTFYRVHKPIERILIGRPVDNTQVHILDARQKPTPIGVAGEIYISGQGLALGYLKRPELSAERFVPDLSGEPDRRMYRTGDLGRYLPSGDIECLGRLDSQVKLRGHRIELGEIDNALEQHAAVRQAAIVLREDRPGDRRLVAYLTLQPTASAQAAHDAELRAHLKQTLPDYMLPASYVRLPHMPLTLSGKIDRRALPAPAFEETKDQAGFVPAATPTQQLLAALWQTALNVPRVSIHDDFFAIGGHSLLASQVLSRLRRDHGIQLPFRKLFEAPTIAQLADVVDALARSGPQRDVSAQTHPLVHHPDLGPAPLSIAQERLWLLEQMDPTQELVHNLPAAWRFDGAVDLALLQRALDEIVRRHETLRTTFKWVERRVVQEVAANAKRVIELIDLSDRLEEEREPAMRALIDQYTRERFDLERGPLFRSCLFRLASEQHVYFSVRHNIIWDGWSFDVFLHELTTLYSAYLEGATPALPELPISYSDYVRWQHQFLAGPEMAEQVAWWRKQLSGSLPDLTLPSDRPRPARSAHLGDNATISLTRADADALSALGRKSGATLFMVLFAAYNVMLHRYSGQSTVLVGTPVRARNRPEAERLIGPFVNTVVLRTKLTPDLRFAELLAHARDNALDAFSHEDMPLERLGTRPPMVRAFFSFQDARSRPLVLGRAHISQVHVEPKAAASDLMLWTMETPRELLAFMNYSSELFDAPTMQRFLAGYRTLLRGLLLAPEARIGDLPIAADGDSESLRSWGTPEGEAAPELSARVQRWAAEAADRIAVSDGERALSYSALWQRARALASALAEQAAPGAYVAVLTASALERAVALVAADLGCTPVMLLDPEHPPARTEAVCAALQLDAVVDLRTMPMDASLPFAPTLPRIQVHDGHSFERSHAAPDGVLVWVVRVDGHSQARALPISRAGLATGALELARTLNIQPGQTLLSLSTVSGELSAYEIALPLMAGATLVQPPGHARIDRLAGYDQLDLVMGPASALSTLSARERAMFDVCAVTSEATEPLAALLLSQGKRLYRVAGIAEANLAPFAQRIVRAHEATRLGRPLYPTRAIVLGTDGKPAPIGVPGRFMIASDLPVPSSAHGERLADWSTGLSFVDTGRRARFMPDGTLDLLPDTTDYVDVSGVRVALAELKAQLVTHPSIADARVLASHTKAGVPRLDAYVALQPSAPFTETELRRHLQRVLPASALPHAYIEVDKQADFADLAKLENMRSIGLVEDTYVAPRTPTEQLLAEHWRKALQLQRVGIHDNFFALGGHSLLCFEVISAIETSSGRRLSPRIMLLGTLAQVALELDATALPTRIEHARRAHDDIALTDRLLQKLKGLVR